MPGVGAIPIGQGPVLRVDVDGAVLRSPQGIGLLNSEWAAGNGKAEGLEVQRSRAW